jgi:phosphoglycerol transferase MdoB-like AlkP superfamily enzyme
VLESYTEQEDDADSSDKKEELPNIIVVMNESFSDLKVLGDFTTNEDYMPYLHSLLNGAENTVTGYLNVSVCGGNTANTEFEFLTGNSMAFLPQGSIPYQQYITPFSSQIADNTADSGNLSIPVLSWMHWYPDHLS